MRTITYLQAINEALDEALKKDERVFLLGEDIGVYGGGFGATQGLQEKYGKERVRDTPISESAIAGVAVGAAMTGMRPVMELQFSDFITVAMDQLVNQAAKIHYMYGGKASVPLVMRTASGSGTGAAAQHSQSLENWMAHIPGLKVIQPTTAYDAKGLLHAAIQDNNPVMFYEHKLLYKTTGFVPKEPYTIPIGVADIKRRGSDVTIIATGIMVNKALEAAEILQENSISVEVIDPRTLVPLDEKTILSSVKKTKRVIVATEAVKNSGFSAEITSIIAESNCAMLLKAPIVRLGGEFVPMPAQKQLEAHATPQVATVVNAAIQLIAEVEA
ncbi:pyruvate dehydrogenase [Enterococcus plantarum]|uniref:Alpha-ketoacid dehydrogenase subunit beta n=1 Tax=Enterococcus plantarum TaxID=1077675 RepID=A0A2W3ZI98_9ENTE|nr:alpha-ketoacid dehydrogenase subunit beta [Enterococcus plantarum]MBO0424247.1 alpha-ketoacid dehydrogenase subunit beta [Enterococcus plantarum]MBO0468701.1 alpha-ketoacid dehydrogenase subunit beta [Enterococcus plantarum]OEG21003.1 pyruvate dehydrogenase [Enterococcus plantarum]PZL76217.1 alpha-ketoacid dehydrogenase subunit beta [Enterococcus plantarum]